MEDKEKTAAVLEGLQAVEVIEIIKNTYQKTIKGQAVVFYGHVVFFKKPQSSTKWRIEFPDCFSWARICELLPAVANIPVQEFPYVIKPHAMTYAPAQVNKYPTIKNQYSTY